MYGVMATAACRLPDDQRQAWVGHICGLCLGLRDGFGHLSRLATNYDAALVVALCEAQSEQALAKSSRHCPLRRPLTALVDEPVSPAVQYAAGTAMLAATSKLRDNLNDDPDWLRGFRRGASALAERWRRSVGEQLAALGFDSALVERQFARQPALEAVVGGDFAFYSQPTELAVGVVFAHTAALQGRPQNYEPLFEIGRRFGRIMLLLDAYQDYDRDVQSGQFNALAAAYPGDTWRTPARTLFQQAYSELRAGVLALELPQPALLQTLLLRQLGRVGCHSLALCHSAARGQPAEMAAGAGSGETEYPHISNIMGDPDDRQGSPFPADNRLCGCGDCCRRGDCRGCFRESYTTDRSCGHWCIWCDCPDEGCGDCCNCGDGGCGDCSGCDCGNCDCGGCCDCGGGDCGGCDCNCN